MMGMFVAVVMPMIVIVPVIMRMGMPVVRMAVIVFIVHVFDAGSDRDLRGRLRVELLAEQQHHRRAEQRKQRYQPDVIEKVHVTTSTGRSRRPVPSLYCGTAR